MADSCGWVAVRVAGARMVTVVVGVPVVFRFVREHASDDARSIAATGPSMLGEALRSRVFWTIVAVTFASTLAVNGIGVHIIAMFTDRGVLPAQAAIIASALAAGNLAGRLLTG